MRVSVVLTSLVVLLQPIWATELAGTSGNLERNGGLESDVLQRSSVAENDSTPMKHPDINRRHRHHGRRLTEAGADASSDLDRRAPASPEVCTGESCYVGCFYDSWTRTLPSSSRKSGSNTPESCQTYCASGGYAYAGVENRNECYCGNTYIESRRLTSDSGCNSGCPGASGKQCGGTWKLAVYQALASLPTGSSSTTSTAKSTSSTSSSSTTTSKSTTSSTKTSAKPSTTSTKTTAAPTSKTTTISKSTTSKTSPSASASALSYVGCFVDTSQRVLSGASTTSSSLTPASCGSFCSSRGYKYAGVEYGTECYCGNSYTPSAAQSDSKCDTACGGDSKTKCGGGWSLGIYAIGSVPISSTTSSSLSASTSKTVSPTSTPSVVVPPIWSGIYHALPTVTASGNIKSSSYQRLSTLLQPALQNAIKESTHSWEIGTLINSLTEVFYPSLSPFSYDPNGPTTVPWSVLDVVTSTLTGYSWSGSPSSRSSTSSPLARYLTSGTSPVPLTNAALIDGQGALGDPCALGAGVWITAQFMNSTISKMYANHPGQDYAWAVGNQYQHLEAGPRNSNGALSHREGYVELWSDMGYMIPPFLAYIGMATDNRDMLNDALSQWALEKDALMDWSAGLFDHVQGWDMKPWATGNGWMLMGFVRVVASIKAAGQSGAFASTISDLTDTVTWVFYNLFGNMGSDNLVPNYMKGSGDGTGDASGSAMIAAAYYRFRVLAPQKAADWLDGRASDLFDAVVKQVDGNGWLNHVVNPQYPWTVYSGRSAEGQSSLGLMWAARTAAGI